VWNYQSTQRVDYFANSFNSDETHPYQLASGDNP
jgi:hypothetical protein